MSSRVLLRAVLVVIAVAAVVWLGAGLRASDAASDGAAIVNGAGNRTPPAEVARALDLLRDARSFNADRDPEINEVILLSITGEAGESLALAETVVAAEPRNVDTWFALWAAALAAGERRRADRAIAEVRKLDPLRARTLEGLDRRASS